MKSIGIWSYSGLHCPAFWLNIERYSVSLGIQFECGKMRTRIIPNMDTFYAADAINLWMEFMEFSLEPSIKYVRKCFRKTNISNHLYNLRTYLMDGPFVRTFLGQLLTFVEFSYQSKLILIPIMFLKILQFTYFSNQ